MIKDAAGKNGAIVLEKELRDRLGKPPGGPAGSGPENDLEKVVSSMFWQGFREVRRNTNSSCQDKPGKKRAMVYVRFLHDVVLI